MNITTLGINLAKNVFQLHGIDTEGKVVLKKRLPRSELTEFIAKLPTCLIGMEACGGSHYWARKFQSFGHTVKLMNPLFVKAYVICCVFGYVLSLYIINQPFAYFLLQYNISKLEKLIV